MSNPMEVIHDFRAYMARLDEADEPIEVRDVAPYIDAVAPWADELQKLADYANGEPTDSPDPFVPGELSERDYPSGADMVDYVSEMLQRLGVKPTDGEPEFGCVECDGTGLCAPLPSEVAGTGATLIVERHDECETFEGDLDAARFVALCHPEYRWIVYVSEERNVVSYDAHLPMPADAPDIESEGEYHLCTDGQLQHLVVDLLADLTRGNR